MKQFPRDASNIVDYSGTDSCEKRDGEKMKEKAQKYKSLPTKSKRQEKESNRCNA